jgi:hypothetical protein
VGKQSRRRQKLKKLRRKLNKRRRNEPKATPQALDSQDLLCLESAQLVPVMYHRFQGTTLSLSSTLGKFRMFDRDFPCTFKGVPVDARSTCGDIEVRLPLSGRDKPAIHFGPVRRISVTVAHDVAARLISTIQSCSLSA